MTIRILVVDNEPATLRFAKEYFARDPEIAVETSENMKDAARLISEGRFDGMILAYQALIETGIDFLGKINDTGVRTPLIIYMEKPREETIGADANAQAEKNGQLGLQFANLLSAVKCLAGCSIEQKRADEIQFWLKDFIDSMPALVFLRDLNGKYIAVNKMFSDFLGIPESEILGKRNVDFFPKELIQTTEREDEEVMKTGKMCFFQEMQDFKGKTLLLTVAKIPLKDRNGNLACIATIAFDTDRLAEIELALGKQIKLFSNTLESVQDGLCILDREFNVLYANPAMNAIYPPINPPVIGKKCYYAYDNRNSRCPDCMAWRAIEKKEIIREKIVRHDPDGKDRWIEVFHFPLVNTKNESAEGVILYLRDVTERHLAERALSDGDRFISEVLSSIQDGISILDKDLNIVRVNNAMERWYSHALPIVGKKCYEAYHGRTEPCTVCPTQRALRSGKPEYNIVPKTGPEGEIVGWLDLFSFPIRNPETVEIEGVIEYVRDVTDREKMRMAAEASHQQLESLFNSIEDPIHVFDPETYELLFLNAAARELFGDVVGQKCYKALQGLDAPCPFCTNDKIFGENLGLAYVSEQQNLLTKKWYRRVDRAIIWPGGKIVGFTMSVDITDRKLAEERLRQANQKLSILGDVTKHDTYNQLATIQGYVDFIRNTCQDKSVLQYLDRIADAAFAIKRQFEFVADYQNVGVKGPEWIDVRKAFERASKDFSLENISLKIEIADIEVFADPMIEKVFHNLIENSIQHGRSVTEIALRGSETENGYTIVFEDDGVGFPPELRSVLFKSRIRGKSGFGLYLANQILAITGLSIGLSDAHSRGARVEIIVPAGKYRIRAGKGSPTPK